MSTRLEIGRHGTAIGAVHYRDDDALAAVFDRTDRPDETDAIFAVRPLRRLAHRQAMLVDLGDGREGLVRGKTADQALFLAQLSKAARPGKRAELRSDIALPGRALVHVPGGGRLSMSARLGDKKAAKARARALGLEHGWVLRSGFMQHDDAAIAAEAAALTERARALAQPEMPGLVVPPPAVWRRLTDAYGWPDTLIIDPRSGVEPPAGARPGTVDLESYVEANTAQRVDLAGGACLWVEPTRALVAIDVDSGPLSIAEANRAAVGGVADLLRHRNVAGTLVVDTISGDPDEAGLVRDWRQALAGDWVAVIPPAGLSPLGLAEIARQRRGYSIHEATAPLQSPGAAMPDNLGLD